MEKTKWTLKKLIELYQSHFYIEDTSAIPLICAVVLGNKMKGDPIWLTLIGGSSSGKTELINAICGLEFVYQLSTLTPNTLLSGMKPRKGQETSLLLQMQRNAIIVMKDLNTLIAMNREDQQAIMGQLLQVYDGEMTKSTGTGESIKWKGKIGFVAGVTENIHIFQSKYSGLGSRFVNYTMVPPDRIKTAKRSAYIAKNKREIREDLKTAFKEYFLEMVPIVAERDDSITEEVSNKIIEAADFAALARSPVSRDFQGRMELVMSPEMPMRISDQIHLIGRTFMAMNEGVLDPDHEKILYKACLDSIPKGRRMALQKLAEYESITTKGLAIKLGYESQRARMWLEELNVLGICDREQNGGQQGDRWSIRPQYRKIMESYDGVTDTKETLDTPDDDFGEFNEFKASEAIDSI